jgi:hypothetical protein
MSDQPVAEASAYTGQHNRNTTTNIHASSGMRTYNPSNQAAKIYALDRVVTGTGHIHISVTSMRSVIECKNYHGILRDWIAKISVSRTISKIVLKSDCSALSIISYHVLYVLRQILNYPLNIIQVIDLTVGFSNNLIAFNIYHLNIYKEYSV